MPSPESGPSCVARSVCRQTAAFSFFHRSPTCRIGTLRQTVSYPMPAGGVDDTDLREALEAVSLPELANRLDETCHWALQLSPGEQQRLPLPALSCRIPIGCSSTKRPRRWTKQRKRVSTAWCVIGSRGRRCSAWVIGRRFAPFTTGNYSRSPTATASIVEVPSSGLHDLQA